MRPRGPGNEDGDPWEGNEGSGIIRCRKPGILAKIELRIHFNGQSDSSLKRIIPEPSFPSQGSQARGTRLVLIVTYEFRLVPSRFYKSGRAARSGRVEAHGKGERRNFSDWQITVIFLARKCFSCKLIFYASCLDFLTLVYINRSFYDVVSAKCVFLSSISAFNWSSLEYFKMADSDELRW